MFLNHCFMFDSVGVMFDRSISVFCDALPREGGTGKLSDLGEDLVCCLSSVD